MSSSATPDEFIGGSFGERALHLEICSRFHSMYYNFIPLPCDNCSIM